MTVTNEIVARCLSDRSGGYSFYLEAPGTYHIKATDLHGYHLHHILTVTVDDSEKIPTGLDLRLTQTPAKISYIHRLLVKITRLNRFLNLLQLPLMLLGTGVCIWDLTITTHHPLTWAMTTLYVILWSYQLSSLWKARSFGIVIDLSDGSSLYNAVLKLFKVTDDGTSLTAEKSMLSDSRGHYRLLAPEGTYVLFVNHDRYLFYSNTSPPGAL